MRRYSVSLYNVETQIDGSSALFTEKVVYNVQVDFTGRTLTLYARDGGNGWFYKFLDKLNRDKKWKMFLRLITDGEHDYAVELTQPSLAGHTFVAQDSQGEHRLTFAFKSRVPME